MKKYFVVSDIHGEYDILRKELQLNGYDENNKNHILISLGDAFDRGPKSKQVYNYLKKLSDQKKAIVLMGNHTKFLIDYLGGISLNPFNYIYNGTDTTLNSFLNYKNTFTEWTAAQTEITVQDFARWVTFAKNKINDTYPELLIWLKNRPYYFETKNYIFTHASIDTKVIDWHYPHCYKGDLVDWDALTFDDGEFFGSHITNTNKTVVIGHYGTDALRDKYHYSKPTGYNHCYDILKRPDGKVIAIDATTNYSHQLNVLVIED